MLVEAMSADEAFSITVDKITNVTDPWWDWCEADYDNAKARSLAGRWAGEAFSIDAGNNLPDDFMYYSYDPIFADMVLSRAMEARIETMRDLRDRADWDKANKAIDGYDPYKTITFSEGSHVWSINMYGKMILDQWTPTSEVYDLIHHTASLEYVGNLIQTRPQNLWLIPVDFHY